jgi:DNA-binding NtrC family response regulator
MLEMPYTTRKHLMERVRQVATLDTLVLLVGETGTGKKYLGRLIHEHSPRCEKPFVVVPCGAAAPILLERELFGHVKGAFRGADSDRTGKFAAAGKGTLLLDDIHLLPWALQAKLSLAIEARVFEPAGSHRSVPLRARLMGTSQRTLLPEVEAGRFHADLWYRLSVISLYLPPLREYPAGIAHLVVGLIAEIAARHGRPVQAISADALQVLEAYSWPGNFRELRSVLERAVALCPGREIRLGDLPVAICAPVSHCPSWAAHKDPAAQRACAGPSRSGGQAAERVRIQQMLQEHGNNRTRTARALGISRGTLYKKLRRYGLRGEQRS